MITDNGVFCLRCKSPCVSEGNGKFRCYNKTCDYTFEYKQESDGENITMQMNCSFGIDIMVPLENQEEFLKGILKK